MLPLAAACNVRFSAAYDPDSRLSFPADRPPRRGRVRGLGRNRHPEPEPRPAGDDCRARPERMAHDQADPAGGAAAAGRHHSDRPVRRRPDRPDPPATGAGADGDIRLGRHALVCDSPRRENCGDRSPADPAGHDSRPALVAAAGSGRGVFRSHRPRDPAGRGRPVCRGAERVDGLCPADRAERAAQEPVRLSGGRRPGHHLGRRGGPVQPDRRPALSHPAERLVAAILLARRA